MKYYILGSAENLRMSQDVLRRPTMLQYFRNIQNYEDGIVVHLNFKEYMGLVVAGRLFWLTYLVGI